MLPFTLRVGNLSADVEPGDIEALFNGYFEREPGSCDSVTKKGAGLAEVAVTMQSPERAELLLDSLHGEELKGMAITVNFYRD